jgi:hypothetical protein
MLIDAGAEEIVTPALQPAAAAMITADKKRLACNRLFISFSYA